MKTCISAETRASFPLAFASFPLAFALFLLAFAGFPAAANAPTAELQSPIGLWKTVDDKTGKPRALVRIYLQDGKYFGRIEQSFTPGAETRVCSVCTDERRNQPIIGLLIIRNVVLRDGEYGAGRSVPPPLPRAVPPAVACVVPPALGRAVPPTAACMVLPVIARAVPLSASGSTSNPAHSAARRLGRWIRKRRLAYADHSAASDGSAPRSFNPKYRRNPSVVPYRIGPPGPGRRSTSRINRAVLQLGQVIRRLHAADHIDLGAGDRLPVAMIASTSRVARVTGSSSLRRSIRWTYGPYSGRVHN